MHKENRKMLSHIILEVKNFFNFHFKRLFLLKKSGV